MGFFVKMRKKLRYQHGQHLIEYSILLTLVMAGIITMSSYVIRSWNANLQGWDDSIIDSVEDPLQTVAYTLPGCHLSNWSDLGCGGRDWPNFCTGRNVDCGPGEMLQERTETPANCNCLLGIDTIRCLVNDCCCGNMAFSGTCGTSTNPPGLPICGGTPSNGMLPRNDDGNCPDHLMLVSSTCGANTVDGCYQHPTCVGQCNNNPPIEAGAAYHDPGSGYCQPNNDLPPVSVGNTFVDYLACTDATFCEYQCAQDYYAIDGGRGCGLCRSPGIEKIAQPPDPGAGSACPGQTFWFGRAACPFDPNQPISPSNRPTFQSCCYTN